MAKTKGMSDEDKEKLREVPLAVDKQGRVGVKRRKSKSRRRF